MTRIGDGPWGQEPTADWGTLAVDVDGGMVTRPIEPIPGDYRLYYAAVRDAILSRTWPGPVSALAAWRVARFLSGQRKAPRSAARSCAIGARSRSNWSVVSGGDPFRPLLAGSFSTSGTQTRNFAPLRER